MDLGNPIAMGNTAEIYLFQDKIIKLFNNNLPESESSYEANKQSFAYSKGLCVPKILEVTRINGRQALVMEYIKGRTVADILLENRDQIEYYMNILVETQQRIHKVDASPLESMFERLARHIELTPYLEKKKKISILKRLESMSRETKLCHGDYHFNNVILSDDKVSIIDWVDSSSGDIRADVFRTYLVCSQISNELADLYVNLYCNRSGLAKDEVFQWAPFVCAARLTEKVTQAQREQYLKLIEDNFFI